jgi:competence protein ComEC
LWYFAPQPTYYPYYLALETVQAGAVAFLIGVCVLQMMPSLPDPAWGVLVPLLIPLLWSGRWLQLPAAAAIGFLWASLHGAWILAYGLAPGLEGRDLVVEGEVLSIPRPLEPGLRFDFAVRRMAHDGVAVESPGNVRLSWYGTAPPLRTGETWRLTVRLREARGLANPGGFDYEEWLFRNRLRATGYVRADSGNTRLAESAPWQVGSLRHRLHEAIGSAVRSDNMTGVLTALAIGERQGIRPQQWEVMTATGTNHLMAISGLHVGMVAALAFFVARRAWSLAAGLAQRWPAAKAGAVAAVVAAVVYAALAGFSIPTRRALIMVAVAMTAVLLARHGSPARVLAVALVAVLLYEPTAVLAAGFWLSFGAVAAILVGMGGRVQAAGVWWRRWGRVQWVVALALVPLLLLFFQRFSVVSPLANVIAVPLVGGLVVPLTLSGTAALLLVPELGAVLLRMASGVMEVLWTLLAWLASLPAAEWTQHAPAPWTLVPAAVGVLLLIAPRGLPGRWLASVLLMPLFLVQAPRPAPGEAWLTLLDVGQGLATVVRTRHHVLLYDTGPRYRSGFDTGEAVVVPYLRHRGISRVDLMMVSHGDIDHSGGVESILASHPVARILAGGPLPFEPRSPPVEPCEAGQGWSWDGVEFEVLHPGTGRPYGGNEGSCVLRVTAGDVVLLLTGDIEAGAEADLVRRYGAALEADVLVLPHHGSRTSSTPAFVEAVQPRHALVAAGYRNRFGFPHPEVRERYAVAGAELLETGRSGAIHLRLTPSEVQPPAAYRDTARRYWRPK